MLHGGATSFVAVEDIFGWKWLTSITVARLPKNWLTTADDLANDVASGLQTARCYLEQNASHQSVPALPFTAQLSGIFSLLHNAKWYARVQYFCTDRPWNISASNLLWFDKSCSISDENIALPTATAWHPVTASGFVARFACSASASFYWYCIPWQHPYCLSIINLHCCMLEDISWSAVSSHILFVVAHLS